MRIRADREFEDTKPARKRGASPTKSRAQNVYDAMDRDRSTAPTSESKNRVEKLLEFAEKFGEMDGLTDPFNKDQSPGSG